MNGWIGDEQYVNFPRHLELQGIDAAAEYLFGRCLLAPDLVIEVSDSLYSSTCIY